MRRSVLIITNDADNSTYDVMDWLKYNGHLARSVNGGLFFKAHHYFSQELTNDTNVTKISTSENDISPDQFDSIWFRKDNHSGLKIDHKTTENNESLITAFNYTKTEYKTAKYAFYSCLLAGKKVLGENFIPAAATKMQMLIAAKELTIDIPKTIITNQKKALTAFISENGPVITKPLSEIKNFVKGKDETLKYALNYTALLTDELLSKVPDTFGMSLFQEALDKAFEIRTFYLDGVCYSMAIFSQLDNQTMIDFRMYNDANGNRNIPYQLPIELELKIKQLMEKLNLKTGSLDFIKTKSGRNVFLEINGWGQYGMTSVPCNYYLDEKIANYLTHL